MSELQQGSTATHPSGALPNHTLIVGAGFWPAASALLGCRASAILGDEGNVVITALMVAAIPSLSAFLIVMSLNLICDGLRNAIDLYTRRLVAAVPPP